MAKTEVGVFGGSRGDFFAKVPLGVFGGPGGTFRKSTPGRGKEEMMINEQDRDKKSDS